jgi:hypothetical protein
MKCAPLKTGVWNGKRTASRVAAVGAGFVLLSALPVVTFGQSPAPFPRTAPPARPLPAATPADDFAGLRFTDDEKAKIDLIRKNGKLRRDTVVRDEKLSPEQKDAMLKGLERIERGQIYQVLAPDQQAEVRKRVLARRETAAKVQQEQRRQSAGQ